MIKSMTGYGKSSLSINSREYQVEIKTVNHKYIDTNIKMPRIISYLEEEIRKTISSKIKRGKIDVSINFENYSKDGNDVKINTELAKIYIQNLRKLAEEENLSEDIQVTDITKMPDVLIIKNVLDENIIKEEIKQVLNDAIEQLLVMREKEGIKISEDILNKSRLMQEIVIYADKCSVEEEITRMRSHISQLRELIKTDEPTGKKMDFIIQEMNRETNTIGSKANKLEITDRVVAIKTILEDIREQIQNVE